MSRVTQHDPINGIHKTRAFVLAAAFLLTATVSGCGTSSPHATTTTRLAGESAPPTTTTTATGTQATKASSSTTDTSAAGSEAAGAVAYSKCMRADGVPDFPDPTPGRGLGFKLGASVTSSPAFNSAQQKCRNLLPGGPGFQSNPSKRTMAKLLKIANCMRAHSIHQFPDPLYSRPTRFTPGEYQEITDFDGATLLFPTDMDLQAPAYRQALTACHAPPLGLPH